MGQVKNFWIARIALIAMFLAFVPALSHAQTASVSGIVTDQSAAVLVGATVTATNEGTNVARTTETDGKGFYQISSLQPGPYTVSFSKSGFQTLEFNHIQFLTDQAITLNESVKVTSVAQSVTVNELGAAPVDLTDAQLSNVVESDSITSLPLITRDPYQLVLLGPGVIQSNSGLGGFSANGQRERNNNFLLDGTDNNDTDVPGNAGGLNGLNPDSTQEFVVITNSFAPEYGRNNGAIIDAITKSGTNKFHGDGYYFGRWDGFGGARDFFKPAGTTADPDPQNPYERNIFGVSVGGPIQHDKTFFFVNYDASRFITTLPAEATVPTAAFKTGIFTYTNTQTGASQNVDISTPGSANNASGLPIDPTIQKILALYPNPTVPSGDGITGTLLYSSASRQQADDVTTKVDHVFNSHESMYVRYAYNRFTDPNPFFDNILPGTLGQVSTYQRTQNAGIGLVSQLRPSLVNEFRFGANRTNLQFNCTGDSTFNQFGGTDSYGRGNDYAFPTIQGFGCVNLGDSDAQARYTGTYQPLDNLTWTKGTHTFKFGGEFRDVYENEFDNFSTRPTYSFNSFQEFGISVLQGINPAADTEPLEDMAQALQGLVFEQSEDQYFTKSEARTAGDLRGLRQREYGVYAQDTWKVKPNLTLTYGLRWEYYGVPFEAHNNLSTLYADPSGFAPFTFTTIGPGTGHNLYAKDFKDFEPRVGFAWDPFHTGKLSIRGGYGIFHDRVFGNLFGNTEGNPPFTQALENVELAPLSTLTAPATVATSATALDYNPNTGVGLIEPIIIDPKFQVPISQNWNFGFERQIGNSFTVEANYVGVHGDRISRDVDGNPPQPALVASLLAYCQNAGTNPYGCDASTLQFATLRYGAVFGEIPFNAVNNTAFLEPGVIKSVSASKYQGLQTKATKRMSHGLQVQGAYTYSHALDNASDPLVVGGGGLNRSYPRNSLDLNEEWGNSDFDVRHRGVISFIFHPNVGRGTDHMNSGFMGRVLEGWELSGIATFQTGLPYDVFTLVDDQHTGLGDRPQASNTPYNWPGSNELNYVGPRITLTDGDPYTSTRSNIGRNLFRSPGINTWNAVLQKDFTLTERMKFELRFEGYNLFNHPQLGVPSNNNIDEPQFGQTFSQVGEPDGTTGARQIQVGAKLIF